MRNLERAVNRQIPIPNSWSAHTIYPGNQISWYLKLLKIPGIVSGMPNLEKGGQSQILISNSWLASLSYPANQISGYLKQ
jgi:hypothetical protein